ncbi:hypothetical protein EYR40_000793 [Pleurotus pulmonarius]|nr:hypothetical protein EYR36_004529 [Pleurotus pulmonarius]KAF4579041.1 hypothetical protein EYR36_000850 [Pleurotus pulmonarius]KAF4603624.1 hypothetical protein EYR38_004038 [Pleurotus pulmonarius]KAF4608448.1 hypothetical protein EYR40_000793 [Pleurotus pulmonarius]
MSSDVLLEEFEVLESIYPTELSKLSDTDIQIEAEPDDPGDSDESVKLLLKVHYPDAYPDVLPELSLEPVEGEFEDEELDALVADMESVGRDNLGMAMTFTLVSHLREILSNLIRERADKKKREEREKERLALEAEEARTRGTPVTVESFKAWKARFDREMAIKKAKEDEERLRGMTAKEREEWKRMTTRLSGRQLFERGRDLEDEALLEEGAVSVDISQYDRSAVEDEAEEEHVTFSDSD